jgi:hypothetical protein
MPPPMGESKVAEGRAAEKGETPQPAPLPAIGRVEKKVDDLAKTWATQGDHIKFIIRVDRYFIYWAGALIYLSWKIMRSIKTDAEPIELLFNINENTKNMSVIAQRITDIYSKIGSVITLESINNLMNNINKLISDEISTKMKEYVNRQTEEWRNKLIVDYNKLVQSISSENTHRQEHELLLTAFKQTCENVRQIAELQQWKDVSQIEVVEQLSDLTGKPVREIIPAMEDVKAMVADMQRQIDPDPQAPRWNLADMVGKWEEIMAEVKFYQDTLNALQVPGVPSLAAYLPGPEEKQRLAEGIHALKQELDELRRARQNLESTQKVVHAYLSSGDDLLAATVRWADELQHVRSFFEMHCPLGPTTGILQMAKWLDEHINKLRRALSDMGIQTVYIDAMVEGLRQMYQDTLTEKEQKIKEVTRLDGELQTNQSQLAITEYAYCLSSEKVTV